MLKEFWNALLEPPYVSLLIFAAGIFAVGLLIAVTHQGPRKCAHQISSCFAIVFTYIVAILAFGEDAHMDVFSNALPFFGPAGDFLTLSNGISLDWYLFFVEVSKLFYLALIINLIQLILELLQVSVPHMNNFFAWYLVQCIIVVAGLTTCYVLDRALSHMGPDAHDRFLTISLLVLIIGIIIVLIGSVISAVKAFFLPIRLFLFENPIGKVFVGALLTTGTMAVITLLCYHLGSFTANRIDAAALSVLGPVMIILLAIWYLVWAFVHS